MWFLDQARKVKFIDQFFIRVYFSYDQNRPERIFLSTARLAGVRGIKSIIYFYRNGLEVGKRDANELLMPSDVY